MKVLMFGWEFPPHILGGLGTASYGLTKGMSQQPDMDITFCIPKPWGDEDQSFLKIIGMNSVPIVWRDVQWDYVNSRVGHYMDPQLYYDLREHIYADFNYMHTNDLGCMEFSGRYPDNLHEEINNYSIVAGVVARQQQFDIIHSHDWLTYPAGIHAKQISGKPLVIHCVKAFNELIELKKKYRPQMPWVVHGFRNNLHIACRLMQENIYFSLGERYQPDVLRHVPLECLLAETDESTQDIRMVIGRMAETKNVEVSFLCDRIDENARKIFFRQ